MLYGLLITLFSFLCVFLILLILVQKGKSSMGLGSLGGGTQLLFGGSGGQDLFQKITWGMGITFMVASLVLAIWKKPSQSELLGQIAASQQAAQAAALPKLPQQKEAVTPPAETTSEAAAQTAPDQASGTAAESEASEAAAS